MRTLRGLCCAALVGSSSLSATGLLWNENDVAVWRDRAIRGPYKNAGDSFDPLVPGEWDRIVSAKDTFMANPSADRQPLLEIPDNGVYRGSQNMVAAAFYALVEGDATVASAVKTEILWHAREPGTQVSPTQSIVTDQGNWWKASWLLRFLISADFIEEKFSTAERAEFDRWLSNWAQAYESSVHEELNNVWPNRYQRDYSTPGFATTSAGYTVYAYQDANGVKHNLIPASARYYNNRRSTIMQLVGLIAVWLEDATLIDRAKLYVEEWLQFSVFPDGSVGEFERNNLSGNVQQGLIYNAANLEACIAIAAALSRRGDDSLFEYSTRNGRWGTESVGDEPAKNLKMVVYAHLDLIEQERDWYFDRGSIIDDHRIDATSETGSNIGYQWVSELYFAPLGNRYWKDARIQSGYLRTSPNSIPYSSRLGSAGPLGGPWGGHQAAFPSLLFMFAETEALVTSDLDDPLPDSSDGATLPVGYRETQLAGQVVFGLDPAWAAGSEFDKVFDGDPASFYDYAYSDGGFVGIDLGESVAARAIHFHPRFGQADRMVGGRFEGSNESSVSGYELIAAIDSEPEETAQVIGLEGAPAYRYYRYLSPAGGFGNIAEFSIELEAALPIEPEPELPSGYREAIVGGNLIFGLDPVWAAGREFEKVFDGDPATFYDYIEPSGGFVGLDLGEPMLANTIQFHPRSGQTARMVGGRFEASNDSTVSGYQTLHIISAEPANAPQLVELALDQPYRYYRYVSPSGGYANIAEFSVDVIASDGDQLPDDWEVYYFGGTEVVNGGENEDFDGDGSSNYEEWVAGTDPTNPDEFLELTPVVGVAWFGVNNRSYEIEYSDDNWKTYVTSEVLFGRGEQIVWVDPSNSNLLHKRQYRVLVTQE